MFVSSHDLETTHITVLSPSTQTTGMDVGFSEEPDALHAALLFELFAARKAALLNLTCISIVLSVHQ